MECIFFIIFFIGSIVTIIAWINNKTSHRGKSNAYQNSQDDQKYWNALMVLDAAEHGFFWPGAESVFDELDEPVQETDDEYEDGYFQDEYYDDHDNGNVY